MTPRFAFLQSLLLLIAICIGNTAQSQTQSLSEKAQISLLTCGTGEELYSLYGHTALRINDPINQIDVVYNYGAFDFSTPNFYGKFVKGDLEYFVSTSSFQEFNYSYVYDNRDIFEQKLNLTHEQKQKIFTELNSVLASEKRFYTYKFIDRNCTTMVRDVINNVLTQPISTEVPDTQKNYRQILYDYQTDKFYENLGINLIFGAKTDRQSDQLFLPIELLQGIEKTKINGKPLSDSTITVFKSQNVKTEKSLWNNYYTFALVMLSIAFLAFKKRVIALTYLTIIGLLGLFFTLVGLYSFHQEVLWNYNVLVLSPLYLALVFLALRKNTLWTNRLVMLSFGLIAVYTMYMLNKAHLIMMVPFVATCLTALWKVRKEALKN
ncbi:lipoprotein N-acyltransferase Lnb domain-containing protein [Flavobacterium saliperosum]|uniref:Lnb N-terminal periplasmic domain-containing protein n=1 Tax=Flavobacterium saliperosum TaxID=329186 RepID=A0A1G4VPN2_9FLAO|nr:DUF4105 domain-containing protein [Flavobacterium saliperosum]SCX09995.1 protein of unknown function [Flavobacterium saliperosum]